MTTHPAIKKIEDALKELTQDTPTGRITRKMFSPEYVALQQTALNHLAAALRDATPDENGLLPCPFCGYFASVAEDGTNLDQISCSNSECEIEPSSPCFWSDDDKGKTKAIEAWNTRATEAGKLLQDFMKGEG